MLEPLNAASLSPLARIQLAWPELCGGVLGQRTHPMELSGATLVIGADDEQWADGLRSVSPGLISACKRYAPGLKSMEVRCFERQGRVVAAREPKAPPHPDNEDIEDPGLRDAMNALLEAVDRKKGQKS